MGLGLTNREIAELRYQGLYQVVDLTKNFFFSYTYDLTRSLQENFLGMTSRPFPPPPFKDMYGKINSGCILESRGRSTSHCGKCVIVRRSAG